MLGAKGSWYVSALAPSTRAAATAVMSPSFRARLAVSTPRCGTLSSEFELCLIQSNKHGSRVKDTAELLEEADSLVEHLEEADFLEEEEAAVVPVVMAHPAWTARQGTVGP